MMKFLFVFVIFNGLICGQTTVNIKISDTISICHEVPAEIIFDSVGQKAKFDGGINAFKKLVEEEFDTSVIENEKMAKAKVNFVIDKDGSIYKIKITGNNSNFNSELTRAIKSVKQRWTPATNNGKAVKSYYRMSFKMKF